jgi:hypothetical protein
MAKRKGSLRLTACLKVVIFAETGSTITFRCLNLRAIDGDLSFLQKHPFDVRTEDRGRTGGRSSASAQKNFTP